MMLRAHILYAVATLDGQSFQNWTGKPPNGADLRVYIGGVIPGLKS